MRLTESRLRQIIREELIRERHVKISKRELDQATDGRSRASRSPVDHAAFKVAFPGNIVNGAKVRYLGSDSKNYYYVLDDAPYDLFKVAKSHVAQEAVPSGDSDAPLKSSSFGKQA